MKGRNRSGTRRYHYSLKANPFSFESWCDVCIFNCTNMDVCHTPASEGCSELGHLGNFETSNKTFLLKQVSKNILLKQVYFSLIEQVSFSFSVEAGVMLILLKKCPFFPLKHGSIFFKCAKIPRMGAARHFSCSDTPARVI